MMGTLKKNVDAFNADVVNNQGYKYTTNAPLSSILANKRMNDGTLAMVGQNVKSIIDIGAGDGSNTKTLLDALPNVKVAGFDPAAEAIKIASAKHPNIQFFVGDILNPATFPHQKFDLAIFRGVLHHLSDPELAIKNSTLMADRVIIVEPNGNNPILKLIEKNSKYHIEHEERSFKSSLLLEWCERSGFVVEQVDFVGFIPFFFPTFLTRVIFFFQPVMEKIYPLKKYFGAQVIISCRKK